MKFGPDYGPRTEWENLVLLEALQAAQGQVGARVRGVAIDAGYEVVVVHACIDSEDDETAEDLAELAGDIESSIEQYVVPAPAVELHIHVGDTDTTWPGYTHRRLFLMHWRARDAAAAD